MQIISNRNIRQRTKQASSRNKENKSPLDRYHAIPKASNPTPKKRYLQIHSMRVNDSENSHSQNDAHNKTVSTIKRVKFSKNLLSLENSEYASYRSKGKICNLLKISNIRFLFEIILSYLDVRSCKKLFSICKALQSSAKKGLLNEHIQLKILNRQVKGGELVKFCMYLAGASQVVDTKQFSFYASIPCKLEEEILQDARILLKQSENLNIAVSITKALRVKNPHIVYCKAILLLVHKLMEIFGIQYVFPLLDRFLNHMGAACLYGGRKSQESLTSVLDTILRQYATHLGKYDRQKFAQVILNKWLRPFFTYDKILSKRDWLTFFQLFLLKGWKIVLELIASMVATKFMEGGNYQTISYSKHSQEFFRRYQIGQGPVIPINLDILSEFNAILYMKKQPTQALLRTRYSENITLIGGKRSNNRLKSTQALRQNNSEINRSGI